MKFTDLVTVNLLPSESIRVTAYSHSPFETEVTTPPFTLHIAGVRLSEDTSTELLLGIFTELVFVEEVDLSINFKYAVRAADSLLSSVIFDMRVEISFELPLTATESVCTSGSDITVALVEVFVV